MVGTSVSTPQVAAALDTVWAVWPDMDILDLRNLAFRLRRGHARARRRNRRHAQLLVQERSHVHVRHEFHLGPRHPVSMTCLFTPNGGLQNPVTGNAISGGISGPLAGVVTGASITGVDYTGRDFGYGFAYPVARENYALLATTAVQPSAPISRNRVLDHGSAAVLSTLAKTDRFFALI